MVFRIVIADDESKIIQLIEQLGHWDELGIEIVAVCYDGAEAITQIRALKPDIVLTDIKMPIYDGIQLIEKTREVGIDSHFIVLSGYKYFDYARSAIQLGVIDYLLKPLDEEQLNKTLAKTCLMIEEKRQKNTENQQLASYKKQEQEQMNEKLVHYLMDMDGMCLKDFPDIQAFNQVYHTEFEECCFRCVYITTDLDSLLGGVESLFSEKLMDSMEAIFAGRCHYVSVSEKRGTIILLNYEVNKRDEIKQAISALFYSIKNLTEIYGNFILNLGVSLEKEAVSLLSQALKEAFVAEWGRLIFFSDRVLEYDQVKGLPRFKVRDLINTQLEADLMNCIRYFQFEEMGSSFAHLYKAAQHYSNFYPGDMHDLVNYLENQILPIHIKKENQVEWEQTRYELAVTYKKARNFFELLKLQYLFLEKWLREKLKEMQINQGKPVDETKKYIQEHYAESLSLDTFADKFQLTSTYFSKLFKAEAGIGFSEYVIQIRIEKAKDFLLRTNESIKTISGKVGYLDDKYFARLFKKQVGIKPSDFRKVYTGGGAL